MQGPDGSSRKFPVDPTGRTTMWWVEKWPQRQRPRGGSEVGGEAPGIDRAEHAGPKRFLAADAR
jgi:hypothetical protein